VVGGRHVRRRRAHERDEGQRAEHRRFRAPVCEASNPRRAKQ
jgi:hypothetical protein